MTHWQNTVGVFRTQIVRKDGKWVHGIRQLPDEIQFMGDKAEVVIHFITGGYKASGRNEEITESRDWDEILVDGKVLGKVESGMVFNFFSDLVDEVEVKYE